MAITLTGAEGYFTRTGREIGGINENTALEGVTSNNRTSVIASAYRVSNTNIIDGLYTQLSSQNSANSGWINYLSSLPQSTLIQQFLLDSPPIPSTDNVTALNALIKQMKATSQSINKPTVASTVTAGSTNVGNGQVVVSTSEAIGGVQSDYILAETLALVCTADGYPGGGATAGQEPFSILGEIQVDPLAWNWPKGSGANNSTNTIDPSVDGGILTNGSFDTWPDSAVIAPGWSIQTGTMNTTIFRDSATPFGGTYDLKFVGNGSELTAIRQAVSLAPSTVYHFNLWLRTDGTVAAGVLRFRLINTGTGGVVNDDAGNPISFTRSVSTLTASYQAFNGAILTPSVMPSSLQWEIGVSTAITNTEYVLIDDIQIVAGTSVYAGGPIISVFKGGVNFATNDSFDVAITNSLGTTSFARSLDRIFGLRDLGLTIPSSNSPTIPDNLIG